MPTPYGDITTTQDWLQPAEDEDDEEMAEDVAAFDKAMEIVKEEDAELLKKLAEGPTNDL